MPCWSVYGTPHVLRGTVNVGVGEHRVGSLEWDSGDGSGLRLGGVSMMKISLSHTINLVVLGSLYAVHVIYLTGLF